MPTEAKGQRVSGTVELRQEPRLLNSQYNEPSPFLPTSSSLLYASPLLSTQNEPCTVFTKHRAKAGSPQDQ